MYVCISRRETFWPWLLNCLSVAEEGKPLGQDLYCIIIICYNYVMFMLYVLLPLPLYYSVLVLLYAQ